MNIKYILPVFAFAATSAWAQQDKLSSGIDKANMDLNAKPGTDFYQYATGGCSMPAGKQISFVVGL